MGVAGWLGLVACVVAGGVGTLMLAKRLGVVVPTIVGMAAQGLLAVVLFVALGLWAPDAGAYDELGRQFADYWSGGPAPDAVGEGKEAFPVMLGAVYYLVGPAPAIGLAFNWIAHGLLIVVLAGLAARADLPVRLTAWMAALFPPGLFWSALLLRESISWLLMALFLYALVGLARRVTVRDLVTMALSLAALLWFRGTAAVVLAGVGMAVLVLTARRQTFLPRVGAAALALLVLSPRLAALLVGYTSVSDIEAKRSDLSNADTGFAAPEAGADTSVASGFVDSIMRVAFGPYPWEWPSIGAPFAFDAVVWLTVVVLALLGWFFSNRRLDLLLVLLPALALSGALMLTSGNYGTMQRLRAQTSVLMLPVAAAGLALVLAKVQERRASGRSAQPR